MDFWDLTRLIFHRWYISAPMLLLTFGGALWTVTSVEPDYIATAHVQLVPPATTSQTPVNPSKTAPTSAPRNPWLDLGLVTLSSAGSVTVQDQKVIEQLEAANLSDNYTVSVGNQIPLVSFEVVGDSKTQAMQTVDLLTRTFDKNVLALQDAYGAPKAEMISTRRLDLGSNVSESNSKVKRALVAVAGAGVLMTAALTIAVDALLRRRSRTRRDDGTDAASVSSIPDSPAPDEPASAAVPQQRNGSTVPAAAPVRPAVGAEPSEVERTMVIRQPLRSGASGGNPQNGNPQNGNAQNGNAQNGRPQNGNPQNGSGAAGDDPKNNGAKSGPPGEATIIVPNIYGSVYGRRSGDKERE